MKYKDKKLEEIKKNEHKNIVLGGFFEDNKNNAFC